SKKAWDAIANRREPVRSWYLNLSILKKYQQQWANWHPQGPNTSPVSLYLALSQALDEILKEGLKARFERHIRARDAFRAAVKTMGLTPFVRDEWASKTLTAVCLPEGINGEELRNNIEKKHDILLAGGLGATANTVVRVGHLSLTASSEYLLPTLKALESKLLALGAKVNTGVAAAKFTEVFGK
ncbi:MAG TPA: hypothetical protein DCL60_07470, partial [Armatimonadetes bacterium]|nr:hypothetical protein [Armatimonadota bacterium]